MNAGVQDGLDFSVDQPAYWLTFVRRTSKTDELRSISFRVAVTQYGGATTGKIPDHGWAKAMKGNRSVSGYQGQALRS